MCATMLFRTFYQPDKKLEEWNSHDFIKYFSSRLVVAGFEPLKIVGPAWMGFGAKVKGFLARTKLSNVAYKEYIDSMFNPQVLESGFTPNFGAITGTKVFWVVKKLQKASPLKTYNDDYFRSLATVLGKEDTWKN